MSEWRPMHALARASAGFSRLELLATTLGLALLTTLGLPLTAAGTRSARAALCADNLHRLARAMDLYTLDHGWFPPNPEDGNISPGRNWVPGWAGVGDAQEFNPDILKDRSRSLLWPFLDADAPVFACPSDSRIGLYQGGDQTRVGMVVPAARSLSLNAAVGTEPAFGSSGRPTEAPWLDNNHGHTYGRRWRTYGGPEHVVAPSPANLFVFIEQDARSLHNGGFAHGVQAEEWINWPSSRHDLAAHLTFADGHVETRRWVDPRTLLGEKLVVKFPVPGSVDWRWLSDRTTAALPR